MNPLLAAVPLFVLLIVADIVAARRAQRPAYNFRDAFSNLGCLMVEQLFGLLVKAALVSTYLITHERAQIFDLPADSPWVFAGCFIGVDLCYYWYHRTCHEVGALWAAHAVHHQSEEFNLTVSFRLGAFGGFYSWIFYIPLAILGFPPTTFLACAALSASYQFCVHTRMIGKLGPIEAVFITPSHHRVHHGRDPEYLNRNYGGVFVLWDRLFGTFVPESREPVYGTVKPLDSTSPLAANLVVWKDLAALSARERGWLGRLRPFVAPPGWKPSGVDPSDEPPPQPRPPRPGFLGRYALLHSLPLFGLTLLLLARGGSLAPQQAVATAAVVVASLVLLARAVDQERLEPGIEVTRLALLLGVAMTLRGL